MKNQYRISKINSLYSKIILCSKEISPDYYASLRKSLILEKITGILTSEVNFESPDKIYYSFDYEDFNILHNILASNKNIQNGIDYIYGMTPYISEKNNEEIMITRLIVKIGIDQYLYMACSQKREIYTEIIFLDDSSFPQKNVSIEDFKNEFSDTIQIGTDADKVLLKLSPRPIKILNILEYLSDSIDNNLLLENEKEEILEENNIYSFKNFIKDTNVSISEKIPISVFTEPRPNIKCLDGFKFSVQASYYNYCEPKITGLDIYSSFEVLSKDDIDEFALYLSNDRYIGTATKKSKINQYNYVPLNLIEDLIENHGGIDKEATFVSTEKNKMTELKKLSYAKKILEKNEEII